MEYRKKHLKPKRNLASGLQRGLKSESVLDALDFFQNIRKEGFISQIQRGIKCEKNCHLTSEGLERFLNEELIEFLEMEVRNATNPYILGQIKRQLQLMQSLNLSKDLRMTDRVIQSLILKRSKDPAGVTPGGDEYDKFLKQSSALNSAEISIVYQARIEKILDSVKSDRQKQELAANVLKRGQSQATSHINIAGSQSSRTQFSQGNRSYLSAQPQSSSSTVPPRAQNTIQHFQGNNGAGQSTVVHSLFSKNQNNIPAVKQTFATTSASDNSNEQPFHHLGGQQIVQSKSDQQLLLRAASGHHSSNDDETNTNSRNDMKSPSRSEKNGAFASHQLINAKLEQIQCGRSASNSNLDSHRNHMHDAPFDPIEEARDLKSEHTASKVGSELDPQTSRGTAVDKNTSLAPQHMHSGEDDAHFYFQEISDQLLKKMPHRVAILERSGEDSSDAANGGGTSLQSKNGSDDIRGSSKHAMSV